jgi:hypothetical protein
MKDGVEILRVDFESFIDAVHVEVKASRKGLADRGLTRARRPAKPKHVL